MRKTQAGGEIPEEKDKRLAAILQIISLGRGDENLLNINPLVNFAI
jgi:hypothetical protein